MSKRFLCTCLLLTTLGSFACAPENKPSQSPAASAVYQDQGIAIKGYDPVAYFDQGMPVMGKAEFSHQWQSATWQFASAEHRDQFKAAPEKYAPQYGGYCAFAIAAKDTLAPTDPAAWKIVEGKLYLNYDAKIQQLWLKDIPGHIATANQKWPTLTAQS